MKHLWEKSRLPQTLKLLSQDNTKFSTLQTPGRSRSVVLTLSLVLGLLGLRTSNTAHQESSKCSHGVNAASLKVAAYLSPPGTSSAFISLLQQHPNTQITSPI